MSNSFEDMLKQSQGYGALDQKEKEIEARRQSFGPRRIWLPAGATTQLIFLDDNPIIIEEHQFKIDGNWQNWFTCLKTIGQACPMCDGTTNKPYTVGFYTVIDCSEYTDKQNKRHQYEIRLLGAKYSALQKLRVLSQKQKEKGYAQGLAGCKFEVTRTSNEAHSTGDMWQFEERLTGEQVRALNPEAKVLDYGKVLAPMSVGEIKAILNKNTERSAQDDHRAGQAPANTGYTGESLPF